MKLQFYEQNIFVTAVSQYSEWPEDNSHPVLQTKIYRDYTKWKTFGTPTIRVRETIETATYTQAQFQEEIKK